MTRRGRRAWPCLAVAAAWLAATPARAQPMMTDPVSESQIRFGPAGINPGLVFAAGYDSNLNSESGAEVIGGPQMFVIPQFRAWTQVRRFVFGGAAGAEFIRVKEGVDRETLSGAPPANFFGELLVGASGSRVSWTAVALRKDTDAKPTGFEIGARSMRVEKSLRGGVDLAFSEKFSLGASGSALRTTYDADEVYNDSNLHYALNSIISMGTFSASYQITPITGVFGSVELRQDTFLLDPSRDTRSTSLGGGVSFRPGGLLSGDVYIGQRSSETAGFPDGQLDGTVIRGVLTHVRPSGQSLMLTLTRDKIFSYDVSAGAYELRGPELSWTLPLGPRWKGTASGAYFQLDYGGSPRRIDTHYEFGGSVQMQAHPRLRFGVYSNYANHRATTSAGQSWTGFQANVFVVYGPTGQVRTLDRTMPP